MVHVTALGALDEVAVGDAARVQDAAQTPTVPPHRMKPESMSGDVVVALRHLLSAFGAGGSVAKKKHANFPGFPAQQVSREPERVVAALRAILGNPVWRHWITELSRDHMLVRYDESGCGLSDWNVPELSFEVWVRDLESVVDAAGLERFALLGISQGAAIAIAYAVRHPERVSHLVLHGAYALGRLKRGVTAQQRDEVEATVKLAEIGWDKNNAATRQFFTTQFIPGATLEEHRSWNEYERMATPPANAARFMQVCDQIDVTDVVPRVGCPTLALHSREDERVPFDEGRRVASLIPGARFVPLESRNHMLLEHEPAWRQWLDSVRAFLPLGATGVFASLTRRELQLVELIAQGLDNAQIAARLALNEKIAEALGQPRWSRAQNVHGTKAERVVLVHLDEMRRVQAADLRMGVVGHDKSPGPVAERPPWTAVQI